MKSRNASIETQAPERAILVQVIHGRRSREDAAESLEELARLADTAGAIVAGRITQRRDRPTAGLYLGEGKLVDVQLACREAGANLVIFDNELSTVQVNNLDLALGVKVIDRTELILQIFARRAKTREAQVQVELAQLQYLVTRIPISIKQHRFSGGIGMKGPGESPFQLRNEPMRRRIRDLKEELERIQRRRSLSKRRHTMPEICLVGYTNAGKSTLLNALSGASAYVDDRLFATLDTKTRQVRLAPDVPVLLTDTVGFIRHLPHGLVASFRSTLQVAGDADLLLVVLEAPHPDVAAHMAVTEETLTEIGADAVPRVVVLNKWDRVSPEVAPALAAAFPEALPISALHKDGLTVLKEKIADALRRTHADRQS